MVRYFARACPRCNGYLEIERKAECDLPLESVNGRCARCSIGLRGA